MQLKIQDSLFFVAGENYTMLEKWILISYWKYMYICIGTHIEY